ncbi:MAG: hypothetical protein ACI9JN_001489 [Bacteroidia bacterium]|jgi:uncharacterized protein YigE (DUF2233 family)
MEAKTKVRRILSFVGVGLIVGLTVINWGWKKDINHTETIDFKDKTFEVFTLGDMDKLVFGYLDSTGKPLRNFKNFKTFEKQQGHELIFAVNGGMFTKAFKPLGLYIDHGKSLQSIRLDSGYGNFYLKPNGVFGMDNGGVVFLEETTVFNRLHELDKISYATQSGPLLVIKNKLHPALKKGSKNVHIRNGVGINKDGEIVFVISNQKTNFYDFATLFRDKLNCSNALYLDGAISKMYNAESNRNDDGAFGVMIGVIK